MECIHCYVFSASSSWAVDIGAAGRAGILSGKSQDGETTTSTEKPHGEIPFEVSVDGFCFLDVLSNIFYYMSNATLGGKRTHHLVAVVW